MALFKEDQPTPKPSPGQAPPNFQQSMQQLVSTGALGGSSGASPEDPPVFMSYGIKAGPYAPGYNPNMSTVAFGTPRGQAAPINTSTVSQAAGQYYNWDAGMKSKFMAQAAIAGYDTQNMKDGQLAALWGNYVAQAAEYYKQGVAVSPWDIIAKDMAQREAYMKKPRTVTQTSKQYDLSTEGDARAIFYTAAQQLLGRDPTKSEAKKFQDALNKMERENPTITKTTSNYVGDELQSQESTSEGGVKEGARQMMAMDEAKQKPEYGAYQAATTYFDATMKAIGGLFG